MYTVKTVSLCCGNVAPDISMSEIEVCKQREREHVNSLLYAHNHF